MQCPTCRRPVEINVYGRVPVHTDFRTGCRSTCPASGRMPEHWQVTCYSPGLEHNRCQAGHPIHHDTTGRYEADTWVHCLIADVVTCPHDSEQILDVRPGKHRVTS